MIKRKTILFFALIAILGAASCKNTESKKPTPAQAPVSVIEACIFSQLAYLAQPQDSLKKYLPQWQVVWTPAQINSNYAFVAKQNNQYAIAIRGSLMELSWQALDNWLYQDLRIASQKKWIFNPQWTDAFITQGAYDGLQNIMALKDKDQSLLDFLSKTINAESELLVTGHSLGGSLATVTASWLKQALEKQRQSPKLFTVISFAAPAAGNTTFAKYFTENFPTAARIENTNDIVPKFPIPSKVTALKNLYDSIPAKEITVAYKGVEVPLSRVFQLIGLAINGIEIANGFSAYQQPNDDGILITIPPKQKHRSASIKDWFAEAGYQHAMAQYAKALGAPTIE